MKYYPSILFGACLIFLNSCSTFEVSPNRFELPSSCEQAIFTTPELNFNSRSENQVEISFQSENPVQAAIFYKAESEEYFYKSQLSNEGSQHSIILNFLVANTTYEYFLFNEEDNCLYSEAFEFKTNRLKSGVTEGVNIVHDQFPLTGGFILTHERNGSDKYFFIINENGRTVWSFKPDIGKSPKVFSLTEDQTIISMLGDSSSLLFPSDQIQEINLEGEVLIDLEFGENGFDKLLHHDIMKKNDLIHAITYEEEYFDLSSIGGGNNELIVGDGILVMDEAGNKIWEWSVFDVKSPLEDPAILRRKEDWLHMNSLWIDDEDNYWLSFRNTDTIWKIDGETGDLIWEYSDTYLSGQHSVNISGDNVFIFNNGLNQNESSALIYDITATKAIGAIRFQVPIEPEYFTYVMGSAYKMEDSMLFCSTINGAILITDFNGNAEWRYDKAFFPFRAYPLFPDNMNFNKYYER